MMKRYQVFLENPGEQGAGKVADVDSLEEAWSWLDVGFQNDGDVRLWWLKDRKAERAAASLMSNSVWRQKAGSLNTFDDHLQNFHGWSSKA